MTDHDLPPAGPLAAAIAASDFDGSMIAADLVPVGDLDLAEAGAVQLQVLMRHAALGDGPAGWKVGMTSGDNRDKMGAGVRPFGFVRRSRLFRSGERIALSRIPDAGIEPELGVRIGQPVGGEDVSREEMIAAIDGAVPCFEIGQRRLVGATPAVRVAADLSQWGVVAGTPVPYPGSVEGLVVALDRDGERIATAGPGYDIDDPVDSLRMLCAALAPYGFGLLPGQYVITGAFAKARVSGPGRWRGDFGSLGSVEVEFA